jgi:membrane protein
VNQPVSAPGPGERTLVQVRRHGLSLHKGVILMARAIWDGLVGVFMSDDLTHAAAIAYYALLSFLPFLMLSLSVLSYITADSGAHAQVLQFVLRNFPTQLDFVDTQLEVFRQARVPISVGGLLALTWASLGVFGALSTAVNHAWKVEQPRGFWWHRVFSFLMMLAAGAVIMIALLMVGAAKVASSNTLFWVQYPVLASLSEWANRLWTFVMFVAVVGLVFYFVPNAKVRFRDVWPGAVLTAALWRLALEGFSWWVRSFAQASVHGSIATVVWFLVWVYISSVLLLYGVEVTANYARLRREHREGQLHMFAPGAPGL